MSWTPATWDVPPSDSAAVEPRDRRVFAGEPCVANILVVDDQPEKLLVYQTVLADLGENILTATSGAEALRLMLHTEFAVILLDVNMPIMDGFETAALIRGRKKLAHTPIIFVTAFGDEMHAAQGYSLGAVDYILTPVIPDILRTKVRVFVQLHRMTIKARQQAEDSIQLVKEQAARTAAEQAIRRAAFLAEASRELSSSLDIDTAAEHLARFVVPFMADVCVLALSNDCTTMDAIKIAWTLSAGVGAQVHTACGTKLMDAELESAMRRSFDSGLDDDIRFTEPSRTLRIAVADDERATIETGCRLEHAALFPLAARGRTLGVLMLGFCAGRGFGAAENAFASELAGRAAIALDNARLYSRIREADRRKDEFLAMLAHELRNPLAPIRNAVEIMRLRNPPETPPDPLCEVIGKEVGHMSRLVDDLLDVSRINRGKITLKLSPVDVAAVTALAFESKRAACEARNLTVDLALPDGPLWVQGDSVRLNQVVTNLLDNAVKFTPEGGRLWLCLRHAGAECELCVRDNGVGMSAELLPDIFNLFVQGERSLDRRLGGLGIGLSLVRDLVDLHAGTVAAHSDGVDKGSQFVVRLPLLAEAPAEREPRRAPKPAVRPQRILVVDDHVDAVMSLTMLLRIYGHTVETAHTGAEALRIAPQFRPRLAVLDIGLPGMDGYQLAAKLLELPEMQGATLIAMTGYGQTEDQRRSAAAGFHHHLVKPVEPAELIAIIGALETPHPD